MADENKIILKAEDLDGYLTSEDMNDLKNHLSRKMKLRLLKATISLDMKCRKSVLSILPLKFILL